jgi:DNA-binding GntR family transcriptional regulator
MTACGVTQQDRQQDQGAKAACRRPDNRRAQDHEGHRCPVIPILPPRLRPPPRLAVSTPPVREAFRDLLAEVLVSIDPHKGGVTRGLTSRGVEEIYELRMVLEPMLARRVCPRITEAQLAAAGTCNETMLAPTDPERWPTLNETFHAHLAEPEHNTRLLDISVSLACAARPYIVLSMHVKAEIIAGNSQDHDGLLRAYRRRDEDAAFEYTMLHPDHTLDAILACVDASRPPAASP